MTPLKWKRVDAVAGGEGAAAPDGLDDVGEDDAEDPVVDASYPRIFSSRVSFICSTLLR